MPNRKAAKVEKAAGAGIQQRPVYGWVWGSVGLIENSCDILIVGAGIIGLTIARELVQRGAEGIIIAEKEPDIGLHASGRNSGVLHAGIYYTPDSLKASSCISGNRMMKQFCKELRLPLLEKGKVVVTRNESELPTLHELHRRAQLNGAKTAIIDPKELAEIEPNAKTVGKALFSFETAQVDPKAILRAIKLELLQSGEVEILHCCRFQGLKGSSTALTQRGPIAFKRFINAAGAHCDHVAEAFGLASKYRLIPFKGIYRKLKRHVSCPVNGNIYPVPDIRNPFLGVHFTRNTHGEVHLGPTAIPALGRENYGLLAGVDCEAASIILRDAVLFVENPKFRSVALSEPRKYLASAFYRDARKLVKHLSANEIEASPKVGIRAQLVDWKSKEMVMDFLVRKDGNSVHVLNPISPAFTCSMDLAKKIVDTHFAP